MMKATGLKLLLPVRPRLGLGQGQFDLARDDRGRATERGGFFGEQSLGFRGNRATVFLRDGEIPARLGANVRTTADGHQRHSPAELLLDQCIGKPCPVAAYAVAPADRRAVAGVVCPDRTHVALCIACGQHRQAVVDRRVPLVAKPGPVAVVNHPPVAAEGRAPLRPLERHRLAPGQGLGDGLLHFIDDKFRVRLDPLILLRGGAALPDDRRVAEERRGVVRVRGRDDKPVGRHAALGQALGQAIRDGLRHAAVVQHDDHRRLGIADHHRPRPQRRVDTFMLSRAPAVPGQQHRVRWSYIHPGHTDGNFDCCIDDVCSLEADNPND